MLLPARWKKALDRAVLGVLLTLVLLPVAAHAAQDSADRWTLAHYRHRAWTVQEGAPSGATSLAQTADGYIWIGTQTGVYRFDGDKFELFKPLSGRLLDGFIQGLFAPRSGGVWVGYAFGGLSFIKDGKITNYTRKDGLGGGTTSATGLGEDSQGRLWVAAGTTAVYRFEDGHFTQFGSKQHGVKWPTIYALAIDDMDTVWLGGPDTLKYKRAGQDGFTDLVPPKGVIVAIRKGDGHSLWLHYGDGRNVSLDYGDGEPVIGRRVFVRQINEIHSNAHGLWMASENEGLMHAVDAESALARGGEALDRVEFFGAKDGLSSDQATGLLEDAEGNIWVSTNAGIDRFRPVNFVDARLPPGLDNATLLPSRAGDMWVGSQSLRVIQAAGDSPHPAEMPQVVASGLAESNGDMWFAALDGIYRLDRTGKLTHVAPSPRPGQGVMIWGMARRRDGSLLAAMAALDSPLFQFKDGKWSHYDEGESPYGVYVDEQDVVWRLYRANPVFQENLVTRVLDGKTTDFHPQVGALNVLTHFGHALWVAGSEGVAWLQGDAFVSLRVAGAPFTGITGMVEDAQGNLWLHGERGVARIEAADLAQARKDPAHSVAYRLFDESDGLPGTPTGVPPTFTAAVGPDGRLWFSTIGGVVWIDPTAVFSDAHAPPVVLKAVIADNQKLPLDGAISLQPDTNNVTFQYGALSFRAPEHVRYRYRLSGVDAGWREAGTATETTYAHLEPGHYRFEVQASVVDGQWGAVGASQAITLLPGTLQTWWFRLLCAAVVAALLVFLHRRRLHRAEGLARLQAEAKGKERERIARDIHDTLLQSTQGLLLMLEVALECDDHSRQRSLLRRTLGVARDTVKEGRDKIIELRLTQEPGERDLKLELSREANELAAHHPVRCVIHVVGEVQPLLEASYHDLVDVAKEALRNAFEHASAQLIELYIEYGERALKLQVLDDGIGIPERIAAAGVSGHFGIHGMQERAAQIGAQLSIGQREEGGTSVVLIVPAQRAFVGRARKPRRMRSESA